ncbi:MAG: PAS domain-containing protein [Acidobacteria bacterium]|nr:PAS domain-containing protein [Acidobacteriota bacterium]
MDPSGSRSPKADNLLGQLSHTAEAVFAVNPEQRIILWNRAAESLLGYRAAEVVGRYCHEVIQGRDGAETLLCGKGCACFRQTQQRHWPSPQKLRTCTKGGQNVWINISTLAIFSPPRKLSILVHLFRKAEGAAGPAGEPIATTLATEVGADSLTSAKVANPLSPRELSVLRLLAGGLATKQIAAHLFISPTTVSNHVEYILRKLEVHSRLEAILWLIRRRLV